MNKVAIIEAKPSRNTYEKLFEAAFDFDLYRLCSDPTKEKIYKKDVDIEIDIDKYEWVILVGSETLKYYTKNSSITAYTGRVVDEKFLPTINPAMLKFKPEAQKPWESSRDAIIGYVTGKKSTNQYDKTKFLGIEDTDQALAYIKAAIDAPLPYIALDSETSALYPRDGYMLGLSLSYERDAGAYISTDCLDEECEKALQELFYKKAVIFHNAKFDLAFFEYHFNFVFPEFEDTMLMHYCLDETQGTHGLKELALRFTKYGDYEKELSTWIADYCKRTGTKKADFTWDLVPFEVMKTYAAIDSTVTLELYLKFKAALDKNDRLTKVYKQILIPACRFLTDIQDNGVPFDKGRLLFVQQEMSRLISEASAELRKFPQVAEFEEGEGKVFNPNSPTQLRKLLFDYIGLTPTGKLTSTGATSTDAEVLEELSAVHEVPKFILNLRKSNKIKNTYIDKIIPQLDKDSRLRTGFNLHSTTSGRLSSSGKLNLQQLPRDNPSVKGCIKALPGNKIVAMDLLTAEMWVAAAISGDRELQDVFIQGGNFHSTIAKKVFNLDCPVEEVAVKHPELRQSAKAVSFGILYQAGPGKIAETVTKGGTPMSKAKAQKAIEDYFSTFWGLKEWIDETKAFIESHGFIYSPFGRKRRLPNVKSDNPGLVGHEIRSGLNFVVQSVSSDINLLGAIDTHFFLKQNNMKSRIFALVHDSVLAEVPEDEIDLYKEKLEYFIQMDRGVSIPNCPVGCDFDIHDDYSLGKFSKEYGDNL